MFLKVLDAIGDCVAKKLWNLVVKKADLLHHLSVLKDYFLMAKGEFYLVLIEEAWDLLSLPPTSKAELEFNLGPLASTASWLALEDDLSF